MNIFEELQSDILGSVPLATVLRKAHVLAYQLKTPELKQWVDHELNGYANQAEDLPEYRKISTTTYGTFRTVAWQTNNQQVPGYMLPKALSGSADTYPVHRVFASWNQCWKAWMVSEQTVSWHLGLPMSLNTSPRWSMKACTASKPKAVLDQLAQAKQLVEGISAAAGLVTALTKAIELVHTLF